MRPDQMQRLQDLSEQLADAFILEADPSEWSGSGKSPADITQQERGDRYWCKKNAMATGGVLRYTLDLISHQPAAQDTEDKISADMDRRIADAERRASAAVDLAVKRAKARSSDERPVSKP